MGETAVNKRNWGWGKEDYPVLFLVMKTHTEHEYAFFCKPNDYHSTLNLATVQI